MYFFFFYIYIFLNFFFLVIGLASVIFGVMGSLFQNKLKLFIAFSGISHIGFIFIAFIFSNFLGIFSGLFYLIFYMLVNFLFFGILLNYQLVHHDKQGFIRLILLLYIYLILKKFFDKRKLLVYI